MNAASRRLACLGLLALLPAGCGRSDIHPVSGSVRLRDGSPVPTGKIIVDSGSSGVGSWGSILPDGTFRMGTRLPADGVPAGEHRIAIVDACKTPSIDSDAEPVHFVHERYRDPATSGLVFRVPQVTTWQIVVDRPEKEARRRSPATPAIDPEMTEAAAADRARREEEFRRIQDADGRGPNSTARPQAKP